MKNLLIVAATVVLALLSIFSVVVANVAGNAGGLGHHRVVLPAGAAHY